MIGCGYPFEWWYALNPALSALNNNECVAFIFVIVQIFYSHQRKRDRAKQLFNVGHLFCFYFT